MALCRAKDTPNDAPVTELLARFIKHARRQRHALQGDIDGNIEGSSFTVNMGKGLGIVAGAGYDFPVSRRLSLTTGVDYWYGRIGNVSILGEPFAKNWKQNIVAATIGITFQ